MTKNSSKQQLIQEKIHGLYAITDPHLIATEHLIVAVEQAILGGAQVIQYRNKLANKAQQLHEAQQLQQLCQIHNVCFIINDDAQLALESHADGIHIGKHDGKISHARQILGDKAIIGVSCYNSLELAQDAILQGADYIAFGRFFPSQTKPKAISAPLELLHRGRKQLDCPIVAIGGVNRANARQLIQAGASAIAVIHELFHHQVSVYNTAKQLQSNF